MSKKYIFRKLILCLVIFSVLASPVSGCTIDIGQIIAGSQYPTKVSAPSTTPETNIPHAEVIFRAEISTPLQAGNKIYLDILDEVTGLALNPIRFLMQPLESNVYVVKVPIPIGSVIKYRYTREGAAPAIEYSPAGKQVRYRLLYVNSPTQVSDIVSGWNDIQFSGPSGRIQGQIIHSSSRAPVPGSIVTAGGAFTLSSSDGSFILEGLPVGKHNLVVYNLNGIHSTFQQEALVAADSTTPALIQVEPAKSVKIKFILNPPANTIPGIPIRLVGNMASLGNTFADLQGGISVLASRAPYMTLGEDGRYILELMLPVGYDLRYKYTIGDGFWNAEHSSDGRFVIRQLIVPENDTEINDTVVSWAAPGSAPITFSVKVPQNTPSTDIVSIQFNPYGWTEPIPMWPLGNNKWLYVLYSPLNILGNVGYRYCRNEQCGSTDDEATKGIKSQGYPFSASHLPQQFEDEVKTWIWMKSLSNPATVSSAQISGRGQNFIAGIEITPNYHPSWQPYQNWSFQNIREIGANWAILTPTWEYTRTNPPTLELVPGKDMVWNDALQSASIARQKGLRIGVYPNTKQEVDPNKWWENAKRDENWWQSWFDRYERFILHHADLAAQAGAEILFLGNDTLYPAYPNGKLSNGQSSNVPGDADKFWKKIIQQVRNRYKGKVYWVLGNNTGAPPSFLSDVDGIYALYTPKLPANINKVDLESQITKQLNEFTIPVRDNLKKPVILGIQFPSVAGAYAGCVRTDTGCAPFGVLDQPNPDIVSLNIDLQSQADFYNAALSYVNSQSWISGFVSRGFYSPTILLDKSNSIRGKPAGDVVWFWFSKLLASPK